MKTNTCCFIGHRKINETEELKAKLIAVIERLIVEKEVDTFFFGSKSKFNDLCLDAVTILKEKYPNVKRIYVRAEFPVIDDGYKKYLLKYYEGTYFPEKIIGSGKGVYVERNCEIIEKSQFCVMYYSKEKLPTFRKSGTQIAFNYAKRLRKNIINLAN